MDLPILVPGTFGGFFYSSLPADRVIPKYAKAHRYTLKNRVKWKLGLSWAYDYGQVLDRLHAGHKLILMDSAIADGFYLRGLLKYRKQIRIFAWNPISSANNHILAFQDQFSIYSHDRSDCKRHGFRFNSTFYGRSRDVTPSSQAHDIVLLAAIKDRGERIGWFHDQLRPFSRFFQLYAPHGSRSPHMSADLPVSNTFMPYGEYLGHVVRCKAVLDILQHGQDSLTLRAMESLFYEKKLITTYQNIVHEPFYHPANIMVVDESSPVDTQRLRDFLDSPYVPVDEAIRASYEFEPWLRRFAW